MQNKEPSVLDLFRLTLVGDFSLWKELIDCQNVRMPHDKLPIDKKSKNKKTHINFPSKVIFGTISVIIAQWFLEPAQKNIVVGIILYGLGAFLFFSDRGEKNEFFRLESTQYREDSLYFRNKHFLFALLLLSAGFFRFSGNLFNLMNVFLWISGILLYLFSVWKPAEKIIRNKKVADIRLYSIFLLIFIITLFIRAYDLQQLPKEMFSDHAEKLLDIVDILRGKYSIFFERNTGREPLQFYLTAAIIKVFNTGIGFLSLKIGMVAAGLVTLIFLFFIGKELQDEWLGIIAVFFAGIAYWPNIVSRVALRFALYPLFTAPTILFMIRGFKRNSRNDFILAGISVGLGMCGYSPARMLPFLVVFAFIAYMVVKKPKIDTQKILLNFLLLTLTALIFFLPIFRYALENPQMMNYRGLSRLIPLEQDYPSSPLLIFIKNFLDAMLMFFHDNGQIWVHSIPGRPALDFVSAAFLFIGIIVSIRKIMNNKSWEYAILLLSIPILLMPSILSLIFPGENPSLNRTAGAYVSVFLIVALGFYEVFSRIIASTKFPIQKIVVYLIAAFVLILSLMNNYDLVFNQYRSQYDKKTWNSSDIARRIVDFINNGGDPDLAYVVPYPHWVDTRLVGINAGFPTKDYALWPNEFTSTKNIDDKKMFILNINDTENIQMLKNIYPIGLFDYFRSSLEGRDFVIFYVP